MTIASTQTSLSALYDQLTDVLYIVGDAVPCEGDGRPKGVELCYAIGSGDPSGVAVIGFARNGWDKDIKSLASMAARHLSRDADDIGELISRAVV